jgi:hypothetical protein
MSPQCHTDTQFIVALGNSEGNGTDEITQIKPPAGIANIRSDATVMRKTDRYR